MKEKYVNIYILSKIPNSYTGFINSSKWQDMIFNIQCGHACVYSTLYRGVSFHLSVEKKWFLSVADMNSDILCHRFGIIHSLHLV